MKSFKFYVAIAALVLTTASCVDNSGKLKAIQAERDSLQVQNQMMGSDYNQTLSIINDIETGFAEISENEGLMKQTLQGAEGRGISRRERIASQMNAIKEIIEQNKAKIAELQRISGKSGKESGSLSKTIKRLQGQLDEKTALIQSLQEELNQKNIKIDELNANITELNNVNEQQKTTIQTQETNLNTAWYCIGSTKKLKEAHILTGAGLFRRKKLMNKDFDQQAFTQVDVRNVSSIFTDSKKVKLLSAHPGNSYNLVIGSNKKVTIEITNPSKFWSVSKYLVVQV